MIVFERTVFGFFRYRKVVFPTLDGVSDLLARIAPNDIVRFNYDGCLPSTRNLIDSFPVSTIVVDLRQSLDQILGPHAKDQLPPAASQSGKDARPGADRRAH
jgi:hypothetical protein